MGVVSTNVCVIKGGGSGGGANGADLPTHLKALSANGGNGFVTLSLEYENTDFVSGVQVNYKLGDYPMSPSDGDFVSVDGAPTSIKVEGLTNKLEYYFRAFPYNEVDGTKYFQTDITNAKVECIPKALEIIGATIYEEGDGYVALITSQDFVLSAPAGTKITLGGGGWPGTTSGSGYGGYVQQHILEEPIEALNCSLDIGAANTTASITNGSNTTLTIGNVTYDSGSQINKTIETKFGTIGGTGESGERNTTTRDDLQREYRWGNGGDGGGARAGKGGTVTDFDSDINIRYSGGNGAGEGTQGATNTTIGNSDNNIKRAAGGKGANGCGDGGAGQAFYNSAPEGENWTYHIGGGGGGGGFSGGGGQGGGWRYNNNPVGVAGKGGQGICVIEYPE